MISLFVRSYSKDYQWLSHSVRSMRANLVGISERILCVPYNDIVPTDISAYFHKIVRVHEFLPGYLQQQVDKVRAYTHCLHDNILFSDSDCIFFQRFDAAQMLDGNKVKLYQTKYSSLAGDVLAWKDITRACTGIDPEYEYMRCFPIMHKTWTCWALDTLHQYKEYLKVVKPNNLSEFNALGVVAKAFYPNDYTFIDTEESLPAQTAKQYWSWGGITTDISKELEALKTDV